ncbi:MAG: HYR domain-containing protein [Acidobacteria bacterium]|nr:HYR domain-containing protein [Acidobacteriota bacterium]
MTHEVSNRGQSFSKGWKSRLFAFSFLGLFSFLSLLEPTTASGPGREFQAQPMPAAKAAYLEAFDGDLAARQKGAEWPGITESWGGLTEHVDPLGSILAGEAGLYMEPMSTLQSCTITCPGNITVPNDPGQCGAVVNIPENATDNCQVTGVSCQPIPAVSFFPVGATAVTCTASDSAGNNSTCTFNVTVNDTEAPTIACPENIVTYTDPGQNGASVGFTATATDNCPGERFSCLPPPGSFFPPGTTTVTCTATDAADRSSSCSFAVTINQRSAWATHVSLLFQIRAGDASASLEASSPQQTNQALLVADFFTNQLKVLLGNGDGTFRPGQQLPVGNGPNNVAVGDFNRDGNTDAVTANALSNDLSIVVGNGDGTFRSLGTIPVGNGPVAITIDDFDGDRRLDLATANFLSDDVSILKNHDGQRFTETKRLAVGDGPDALIAGTFLNEYVGLAVINMLSDQMTIYLGDANGTLNRSQSYAVSPVPASIAQGDFNNDGRLDIAVLDADGVTLRVLLDHGDGTFRLVPWYM